MKIDEYKVDGFSQQRPFKCPDHYFDDLQGRIMEKVSQYEVGQKRRKKMLYRKYAIFTAAASVIGFIVTGFFSLSDSRNNENHLLTSQTAVHANQQYQEAEDDIDQALDYMMIDENDMYGYMLEN